jgi:hypothetical protein
MRSIFGGISVAIVSLVLSESDASAGCASLTQSQFATLNQQYNASCTYSGGGYDGHCSSANYYCSHGSALLMACGNNYTVCSSGY